MPYVYVLVWRVIIEHMHIPVIKLPPPAKPRKSLEYAQEECHQNRLPLHGVVYNYNCTPRAALAASYTALATRRSKASTPLPSLFHSCFVSPYFSLSLSRTACQQVTVCIRNKWWYPTLQTTPRVPYSHNCNTIVRVIMHGSGCSCACMCTHVAEDLGSLDYGTVHATAQATVRRDGHDHVSHISSCHLVVGRRRDLLGDSRHAVSKRTSLFPKQPWRGRRYDTQASRQTDEGHGMENDVVSIDAAR